MKKLSSFLFFILLFILLYAQKPALDHSVYDNWKSVTRPKISPSGNFVFYTVSPQEGDSFSELKDRKNKTIFHAYRASSPVLTENESFFISAIAPYFAQKREARIKKKKIEDMPQDTLQIYDINKKSARTVGPIKSYKLVEKAKNYITYMQERTPRIPKKIAPKLTPQKTRPSM